jgi:hypothetical protein
MPPRDTALDVQCYSTGAPCTKDQKPRIKTPSPLWNPLPIATRSPPHSLPPAGPPPAGASPFLSPLSPSAEGRLPAGMVKVFHHHELATALSPAPSRSFPLLNLIRASCFVGGLQPSLDTTAYLDLNRRRRRRYEHHPPCMQARTPAPPF